MFDGIKSLFARVTEYFRRDELKYEAVDESTGKRGSFRFKIVKHYGDYRAYILARPPLGGRDGSMHKVHVLTDCGKPYVCVLGAIESRKKMEAVARLWARKYMRYVATVKLFEEE